MGDLNARAARTDTHLAFPNINPNLLEHRQTKDESQDRRGNQLLTLLKHNHLSILNGSSLSNTSGSYTSYSHRGASIIDLAILLNHAAHLFYDMKVLYSIISDHMPIQVTLHSSNQVKDKSSASKTTIKKLSGKMIRPCLTTIF